MGILCILSAVLAYAPNIAHCQPEAKTARTEKATSRLSRLYDVMRFEHYESLLYQLSVCYAMPRKAVASCGMQHF